MRKKLFIYLFAFLVSAYLLLNLILPFELAVLILLVIYLLVPFYGVGFGLLADGAKKLRMIDEA